ncbi:hypothetical protein RHGRI_011380 [Rhododendron griersonianum]|uniref:Uncharacterized protein n=1 Tax=Rhododendron griersonianum TaxID=479676 RepID=A0AAV6KMQ7_9ERIC|nr:hypothetical protein RHGRI_011380 [Rhododendron griersonianum]
MVRKKGTVQGKGKGIASSSRREEEIVEEAEHESMEEDSDEDSASLESRTGKREKRRKRRTPNEMEADAKLDWVESILNRGFKSERQISRRRFGNDSDIIIQLKNQGLLFWTRALLGYNEAGVIEFYQNLDTSEALAKGKIKSEVNNKKIEVDAKAIAKYLRYGRPEGDLKKKMLNRKVSSLISFVELLLLLLLLSIHSLPSSVVVARDVSLTSKHPTAQVNCCSWK